MDEIKMQNFRAAHPGENFPKSRHLAFAECMSLQAKLGAKLKISSGFAGLDILRALEQAAQEVPDVIPSDEQFRPGALVRGLCADTQSVYISWYRFDDIDEISLEDFDTNFHDLWYPASDDIEVFDKSLSWVLLVRHFDAIQTVKL